MGGGEDDASEHGHAGLNGKVEPAERAATEQREAKRP